MANDPKQEPHGVSLPTPRHPINYYAIFGALFVLTILTVVVAMHRFQSEAVNLGVALAIAIAKASLVCLFFMHLKFEGKLIYLILLVPISLCIVLTVALIPDIVMSDPQKFPHISSLHLFNAMSHLVRMTMGTQ
jgi:cytochrome c oxidase subunit 4